MVAGLFSFSCVSIESCKNKTNLLHRRGHQSGYFFFSDSLRSQASEKVIPPSVHAWTILRKKSAKPVLILQLSIINRSIALEIQIHGILKARLIAEIEVNRWLRHQLEPIGRKIREPDFD